MIIMGNCLSESFKKNAVGDQNLATKKNQGDLTLAIIGLDRAGKTTIAKCLKGEKTYDITPTVGFSSFSFKFGKFKVTIFDLGGGEKIRGIWRNYYAEIHGLIYVLDASDHARLLENQEVFTNALQHPNVQGKPVLLFINKQDVPGALDEDAINEKLDLEPLVSTYRCPCRIAPCAAAPPSSASRRSLLDPDIRVAFQWLLAFIASKLDELSLRIAQDLATLRALREKEKEERMERIKQARRERGEPEDGQQEDDPTQSGNNPDGNPFKTLEQVRETLAKPKPADPSLTLKPLLVAHSENIIAPIGFASPATPNGSSDSGYKSTPLRPKTPVSDEPAAQDFDDGQQPIAAIPESRITSSPARNITPSAALPVLITVHKKRPLPAPPGEEATDNQRSFPPLVLDGTDTVSHRISEIEELNDQIELTAASRLRLSRSTELPSVQKPVIDIEDNGGQVFTKRKRKRRRLRRFTAKVGATATTQSEDSDSGSGKSNAIKAVPLTPRLAELPSSEPRPPTPLSQTSLSVVNQTHSCNGTTPN